MSCSTSSCASSPLPYGVCRDKTGCYPGMPVDFCLKRHDVKPPFKVIVEDCDGPMDLTDLVLEASMWALAKLKKDIDDSELWLQFADNVGFEQVMVGDIIVTDRARAPEQMLVTDFDEINYKVKVQRSYHGTPASSFKKGTVLRIFRVLNATGSTEMDLEDITQVDGSVATDQITESRLVYDWAVRDTCLPGCYFFEFKLLKMLPASTVTSTAASTPSTGSYTEVQMGCGMGSGVEWVRRYPNGNVEGYVVRINNSPTSENVY